MPARGALAGDGWTADHGAMLANRRRTPVTPNEEMTIEWQCRRLNEDYVHYADFQDFDTFADLFTADGVLEIGGTRRTGTDEIKGHFANRPQMVTRHICTDHRIDVIDTDHATGTVYLMVYRCVGDYTEDSDPIPYDRPAWIGHYVDDYVRTDGGWRFAKRVLHIRFERES